MKSTQSTFQTSLYATPFILDRDISNKYKVNNKNVTSQFQENTIPFLRAPNAEWKNVTNSPSSRTMEQGNSTFTQGFGKGNGSV